MKKQLLSAVIFATLSVASINVQAAPASAALHWEGYVDGYILGTEIAITGESGGAIVDGVLDVAEDGTFITTSPISVEARDYDGTDIGDMFSGGVDWTLTNSNISHGSYVRTDLVFDLNGSPLSGSVPVSTAIGNHAVNISVTYDVVPSNGPVVPGEVVSVNALIMATPTI